MTGRGAPRGFIDPAAWRWTASGNVYVADSGNNTIRKVTPAGVVTTLAGLAGNNAAARTGRAAPRGLMDLAAWRWTRTATSMWRTTYNNTIRKVTPVGTNWVVTTLAGLAGNAGSADGTSSAARFNGPDGVAVDSAGNVYVADYGNNTIRKVTPVGTNGW